MAAKKSRKSRKGARAASNSLTPRQIKLQKEWRQRSKDKKEKAENNQFAELQNQADLVNNPPVIEATPESQIPMPMLSSMPDISFINEPNQRQNVVRALMVIKQEDHRRMAVNGQELGHDPFNRRSTRPRKMGFKPVIPIEAAPAETVEMTASSGSHSTQAQIVGPDDNQVETSNAAPGALIKIQPLSDSEPLDDDGFYGFE